jgi:hydrogenase/urease accessory protein HupE
VSATALVVIAVLLWPPLAEAHLVTTGLGPLYDGVAHFTLTPEDLIPALALALLAGLRGPSHSRRVLFVLPCTWLLAAVVGLLTPHTASALPISTSLAPSISFVLFGALLAGDACLPLAATTAVAAMLGGLHGYLNGAAMAQATLGMTAVIGIATAVFTLVALTSSAVIPLRAAWARIAIRVAGSWIAAIGLLLIGWSLRPTS